MSILFLKSCNGVNSYADTNWKLFKDKQNKTYTGNKVILLEKSKKFRHVTASSYKKYFGKHDDKLIEVEEVTTWQTKRDNLKISEKFGAHNQKCKSHKKTGTTFSTTIKSPGIAQEIKGRRVAKFVTSSVRRV